VLKAVKVVNHLLALPLIAVCKLWKLGPSRILGARCRFHPTCSEYAADALAKYGFFPGVMLATKRLLKCHPLNPGGVDYP
jgi:putative membrane protein insertion efficiency factor